MNANRLLARPRGATSSSGADWESWPRRAAARSPWPRGASASHVTPTVKRRVASTDGFITLPGRAEPNDLYVFGFKEVGFNDSLSAVVNAAKGKAQVPSPILPVDAGRGLPAQPDERRLRRSPGPRRLPHDPLARLPRRDPDLRRHARDVDRRGCEPDVPLLLRAAPPRHLHLPLPLRGLRACPDGHDRDRLRAAGTAARSSRTTTPRPRSTASSRCSSTRSMSRPHDGLIGVQEFVWSEYRPQYWIINGRAYPDTIKPNKGEPGADPEPRQPADLVADPGRRGRQGAPADRQPRLRAALDGAAGHHDEGDRRGRHAPPGSAGADLTYHTNTVYIGPGETRDVLFTAPPFDARARRRGAPATARGTRTSSRTATTTG